ncbi:DUF423 domain-containing protein [Alkalihalobacillus sp. LMS39]|uniref:DUF423 domain-containing protein n=1 Tax=Alkalihalobacillus sp. LMS39 TaxID=2924032 RepID=UPI001FB3DB21|nr:DUF423 domain-containing protein [Alkalihalobacillus sp. LMS39]UOE94001.1 DUF423 domain-containing protein [Alkalihalobacillus sp. LMS39]
MKLFIVLGAALAALAVGLGAFGAHGLEQRLSERFMKIYQTGVQYHMYHAIGILIVGLLISRFPDVGLFHVAGWFLFSGIILFSGSLYIMSVTGITKLGMITPLGGLAFIIGWVLVIISVLRG